MLHNTSLLPPPSSYGKICLYGDAAPLLDVLSASLSVVARSRAYHLLDLEVVKCRLGYLPDQRVTHPRSAA